MGTARYQTLGSVHPNFSRSSHSRSTIYLASAVAVFCAATVFFLLCERDHSLLSQTDVSAVPPTVIQEAATPAPKVSTAQVPATAANPALAPLRREEIPFSLERSRRFHQVGSVNIGVWRIDPRRGTADLSILAAGHRINRNRVKLDETVSVGSKDSGRSLQLILKKIDKNSVSGYLNRN